MKIQVCSRKEAGEFKCQVPWAAISITSNPSAWPEISEEGRVGLLRLYFMDYSVVRSKSMTKGQAVKILEFVKGVWDKIESVYWCIVMLGYQDRLR